MRARKSAAKVAATLEIGLDPFELLRKQGPQPEIDFRWKDVRGKRRLIGYPNKLMFSLQDRFQNYIESGILHVSHACVREGWRLQAFPSATGFMKGSNHLRNAEMHQDGRFFYITDLRNAYPSIDLKNLARLIVYIKKYDVYREELSLDGLALNLLPVLLIEADPLFAPMHSFLQLYCGGMYGEGLAVGGSISPYLMNLYCEAFVDWRLRRISGKYSMEYTRYADDLVFSRKKPITSEIREEIRTLVRHAGLEVNHRKTLVRSREMGTVHITKMGLHRGSERAVLRFPQWKRRRLHGMIGSYLKQQMDWPEKVGGYVAEFLHYFKNVNPTRTDMKTFALCKDFEAEWVKYKKKWNKPLKH